MVRLTTHRRENWGNHQWADIAAEASRLLDDPEAYTAMSNPTWLI